MKLILKIGVSCDCCKLKFKVQGPTQNIFPDIILFLNGLLLGVIECQSSYVTNLMEVGINQLKYEVSSLLFFYLKEDYGSKIDKRN